MHYIVETDFQLEQLSLSGKECFISIIPSSDYQHPKLATISLIYVRPIRETKGYILVIDHPEGFSLSFSKVLEALSKAEKLLCLDAKSHSYFVDLPLTDINYTVIENGEKPLENKGDSPTINLFYQRHRDTYKDVNKLIPISKLYEHKEEQYEKVIPFLTKLSLNTSFYDRYTALYKEVEEAGIHIDTQCFADYFTPHNIGDFYEAGKIYTQYNLYNITARPTNAFNGINFLALNKENHSRKCFIPENDYFVEFDFDGYHIRLIANLIKYQLPEDASVHTYFGKQYFDKEVLTEEEYKEAKQITFQNIYGGIKEEYAHIPFYRALNAYLDDLWDTYQYGNGVVLPTGKTLQLSEDMYPLKLFNYTIQNLETKTNVELLAPIVEMLREKQSKIKLIVYDSFLLDFSMEDGKEILLDIVNFLKEKNYIVKAKYGKDYNSLQKTNYL